MPDMNGEKLGRMIKEDYRFQSVSLVMLTASGDARDVERFSRIGFVGSLLNNSAAHPDRLMEVLVRAWEFRIQGGGGGDAEVIPGLWRESGIGIPSRLVRHDEVTRPSRTRKLNASSRILLAEDNPTNQKLAVNMLEKMGCRVDVASNGKEAVLMALQLPYDLVLMDCQMPELDGYGATKEIRKNQGQNSRIPIIAVTSITSTEDGEKCLAADMDGFLGKPVRPEALQEVLERWIVRADESPPQKILP
jgi:CheY-like chemotaxis protein